MAAPFGPGFALSAALSAALRGGLVIPGNGGSVGLSRTGGLSGRAMRPEVSGLRAKLIPRSLKGRTDFWFRLADLQIIHSTQASGALHAKLSGRSVCMAVSRITRQPGSIYPPFPIK